MSFLDIPETSDQLKSLNIISNNNRKYDEFNPREKNDCFILEKIMYGNVKKQPFNISELLIKDEKSLKNTKEIHISPLPGFVVKTIQINNQKKRVPQGTKVFLNLCHSEDVTPPKDGVGNDIGLKIMKGWHWEIPVILSLERWDVDKAGKKCLVIDCCCNTSVMKLCKEDINIRLFFIETCLELIEDKTGMILSREYTIPKMKAKGGLQPSILEVDMSSNTKIQEICTNKIVSTENFGKNTTPKSGKNNIILEKKPYLSSSLKINENKISKLKKPEYTIEKFFRSDDNTHRFKVTIDIPLVTDITYACLELIDKNGIFSLMFCVKSIYSELEIPIPGFFKGKELSIDAFFIQKDKKLYIFVPYI
ncbi:hypothetical protein PCANB_002751 [Pneumocystis canis]|nr:hypothetical protein PCK1_002730 [Pneumocystis canis]KAG5438645.1 hypothetical protein PCANB_002751 [Pneumocystis canis]